MTQSGRTVASYLLSGVMSSNSVLTPLISAIRDVVSIRSGSSRQEWLEFGEYVKDLIDALLCELESNQTLRNGALSYDFRVFQRKLEHISNRISSINNSPVRRLRYRTLDVERTIETLRRQLGDAISVFQLRTAMEFLSRAHSLDTSPGTAPGLIPENSSSLPPSSPHRRGRPNLSSHPRRNPVSESRISHPQISTMTTREFLPRGEGQVSLQYVDRSGYTSHDKASVNSPAANQGIKRLGTTNDKETHTNHLAATLCRLSDQMASTGNLGDALALSQGAAGLYRKQAERQLAVYYQN